MSSKIEFSMDDGWRRMARAVDKERFKRQMKKHVALGTRAAAARAAKVIRQTIRGGKFASNAPLTIMIKKSSKPLVDNGDLFRAITHVSPHWDEGFAGILQTDGAYNIATFLHDGGEIKVTDAMRGMFFALWLVSTGQASPSTLSGRAAELWERQKGDWLPLKDSTKVIRVPGRPFIQEAFNNPVLAAAAKDAWEAALKRAFRDAAGKK